MRCKYIGDGTDQWLPEFEKCDEPVDTEADKSKPSVLTKKEVNGQMMMVAMFPSKVCNHGLCSYHARKLYYRKYWKKYGGGKS